MVQSTAVQSRPKSSTKSNKGAESLVILLGLLFGIVPALFLWQGQRQDPPFSHIESWAPAKWEPRDRELVNFSVSPRLLPPTPVNDVASCDAKIHAAHNEVSDSVFRKSPEKCTTMKLQVYGTMHSRSKAFQRLLRIDPQNSREDSWKHGLPGTKAMPYGAFSACNRVLITVRHPLVYCKRLKKLKYEMEWVGEKLKYQGSRHFPETPGIVFDSCVKYWSEYYSRWITQARLNPNKIIFVKSDLILEDNASSLCNLIWQGLGIVPMKPDGTEDTSCVVPEHQVGGKDPELIRNAILKRRMMQRYHHGYKSREQSRRASEITTLMAAATHEDVEHLRQEAHMFCYYF